MIFLRLAVLSVLVPFSLGVMIGCSSGGGGGDEPADVAGVWEVTAVNDATDCGEGIIAETVDITVTQDGKDVTIETPDSTFPGTT